MSQRFDTISFLSDYGRRDEFVGVVHSVVRSIAPAVAVLDITHDIAPYDVRAGGLALARSAQYLVPGVVLAVVDPGVGTGRRAVAVEVGDGQSYLVGPDNGLLAPAVAMVGGATAAITLDNPEYHLASPGPTFDGRDVFGPVAAHLCNGVPPSELGTSVDPAQLIPGVLPVSELHTDGSIRAEVLWIDTFGNVQLNVDPGQLDGWPPTVRVSGGDESRIANRVSSFADAPMGGVGLIVDSYGLLTIAIDRGSAAVSLGIGEADEIVLEPVEGRQPNVEAPVSLSPTRHRPEEEPS
ncbi:MAG: SAM-dependent chlorinase/fluorinase [Acidimicrobiia bacterium]|nr:SAM-dependent chlorinase/fluorinase [Acidimicrobiia bacterium]